MRCRDEGIAHGSEGKDETMFDQTENEYTPEFVRPIETAVGERHRTLARKAISAPQTDEEAAHPTRPTTGGAT